LPGSGDDGFSGRRLALEGFLQDVTERKRAEFALMQSEQRLRVATENLRDGFVIVDGEEGRVVSWNKAAERMFGWSAAEMLGEPLHERLAAPGMRDKAHGALDGFRRTGAGAAIGQTILLQGVRKDGTQFPLELSLARIQIDGRWHGVGVVRDVSERERLMGRLAENEQRMSLVLEATADGVFDWDRRTGYVYYSPHWKAMLGYEADELAPTLSTWEDRLDPRDWERVMTSLARCGSGGDDRFTEEIRIRARDGAWVEVLARVRVVRDANGDIVRVVGAHTDMTERNLALAKAHEAEQRATNYLEVVAAIVVALDAGGQVSMINRQGAEIIGLPVEEIVGKQWFDTFIPEAQRPFLRYVFAELLAGRLDPLELVDGEIVTARGEHRTIFWRNSLIRDDQHRIIGTLSSGEDVTERRVAERNLEDERNFLQDLIDSIDDPIVVISEDYEVIRMNRVARGLRHAGDELDGPVICHQLLHDSREVCAGPESPCPLREVMASGQSKHTVHRHRGGDGKLRTLEIIASPFRDSTGQVRGIIEASRDITAQLTLLEEIRQQEENYAFLANHDPLTGLPNRVLFADRLAQGIANAERHGHGLALLFLDIDAFKRINESFNHTVGDELLTGVSERLRDTVRRQDTVARMGGDEFTVILSDLHHADRATKTVGKLLDAFKEPFVLNGQHVFLSVSIGISLYPRDGDTVDALVRNADTAMSLAKHQGRNGFAFYEPTQTESASRRLSMESQLHHAIEQQQFLLHYQPQHDLKTHALLGFEALVRWRHPEHGMVSPAQFIPLAEETGLIIELGRWILGEACRQHRAWRDFGLLGADSAISVNLSARQFDDPSLSGLIEESLAETSLPASCLELEITESIMMREPDRVAARLREFRDMGLNVAIDDFGTGYSSLAYLKRLPLTRLKIDQSFVADVPGSENDEAIVRAIIGLAGSLSLNVIAEGIERSEQLAFLSQQGCDAGQGYLLSRPLPAEAVPGFIRDLGRRSDVASVH
jgi:diguanylate cyclase (GGDEF)-like protein/PAS domain S-box-containing protein